MDAITNGTLIRFLYAAFQYLNSIQTRLQKDTRIEPEMEKDVPGPATLEVQKLLKLRKKKKKSTSCEMEIALALRYVAMF